MPWRDTSPRTSGRSSSPITFGTWVDHRAVRPLRRLAQDRLHLDRPLPLARPRGAWRSARAGRLRIEDAYGQFYRRHV